MGKCSSTARNAPRAHNRAKGVSSKIPHLLIPATRTESLNIVCPRRQEMHGEPLVVCIDIENYDKCRCMSMKRIIGIKPPSRTKKIKGFGVLF